MLREDLVGWGRSGWVGGEVQDEGNIYIHDND